MSHSFNVFKSGASWSQKPSGVEEHSVFILTRVYTKEVSRRGEVGLVVGSDRELLTDKKTSDILKIPRSILKMKTRDIATAVPVPAELYQLLSECGQQEELFCWMSCPVS